METLFKKHLGFNNSSDEKKFTEELIAPKKIQIQNILNQYIPKHAPTEQGVETSFNNPVNFYSPSNFDPNDENCPIGFKKYVLNSTYSVNAKVYYLNRYWKALFNILSTDVPSISSKWLNVTEEALKIPLRKRYNLQLAPLSVNSPNNYSFRHNPVRFTSGTLLANNRYDTLLVDSFNGEIMVGDNILIPFLNIVLKVIYVENGNLLYIYKFDPTDELYDTSVPNNGLTTLIPNGTVFNVYPKKKDFLINIIDFAQDDEKTFTPQIKKVDNTILPFGLGDYFIDSDIGIVTFQEFLPQGVSNTQPIKISHYQYVGDMPLIQQFYSLKNISIFTGTVKELLCCFEINVDKYYMAFKFRGILGPNLTITIEFFDFNNDVTLGIFNITNSENKTMEVMQILCIDKFAGKIEIRGIKNNDVMVDQLSLTLL